MKINKKGLKMRAYDKMVDIADKLISSNEANGTKYLGSFQEDLSIHDRSLVEFQTPGSNLVWQIYADGTGTSLYDVQNLHDKARYEDNKNKKSKLFTISILGGEEADINEVCLKQADKFIKEKYVLGKSPKLRNMFIEEIATKLGYQAPDQMSSDFKNDLKPTTNESIYFKAETDKVSGKISCTILKPTLLEDRKGISRTKKQYGVYSMKPNSQSIELKSKTKYFKVTPHQNIIFGKVEDIDSKEFEDAFKSVKENTKKHEISFGMN